MPGRFSLNLSPKILMENFGLEDPIPAVDPWLGNDIRPSQTVAVIAASKGKAHLGGVRWGFIPKWATPEKHSKIFGSPLINARDDSLEEKASWKDAFKKRRCIVPASWYYEWKENEVGQKIKYKIAPTNLPFFAFAALWEANQGQSGCATITVEPNDKIREIHHRMGAILTPDQFGVWLHTPPDEATSLLSMLKPLPDDECQIIEDN
jgi:putative SOS response-associated peptidase YedK